MMAGARDHVVANVEKGALFALCSCAMVAERAAEIVEAQLGRALDPLHPQGHAAAVDLLNRIMPPETRATLAGDPDAPVAITRIERIIIEPQQN